MAYDAANLVVTALQPLPLPTSVTVYPTVAEDDACLMAVPKEQQDPPASAYVTEEARVARLPVAFARQSAQPFIVPDTQKVLSSPSNSCTFSVKMFFNQDSSDSFTVNTPPVNPASPSSATDEAPRKPRSSAKKCRWCDRTARGGSELCAHHGGGRRCFCGKIARGSSSLCGSHGGGRRCAAIGCSKGAAGRSDFCIAHGGGRRCEFENCIRAAHAGFNFCFKHGGGRRCQHPDCSKGSVGKTEYCIAHGGGRRCGFGDCAKGAAAGGFCVRHGGGRRCAVDSCGCVAQTGSSVCLKHGGGKKCCAPGCSRSVPITHNFCLMHRGTCEEPGCGRTRASEMTDRCVLHGGGKVGVALCEVLDCDLPAQKGSHLCRVHAPKRSRKGIDPFMSDSMSYEQESTEGDYAGFDFTIDLGDSINTGSVLKTEEPVGLDHAQLMSLLQNKQPTLAD